MKREQSGPDMEKMTISTEADQTSGPTGPASGHASAARLGGTDWGRTPLGPYGDWPPELRTATEICLTSPLPCAVWWGEKLIQIGNEHYARALGQAPESVSGQPAAASLLSSFSNLDAIVEEARKDGEASGLLPLPPSDDAAVPVSVAVCLSALHGNGGHVGGYFVTVVEASAIRTEDEKTMDSCDGASKAIVITPAQPTAQQSVFSEPQHCCNEPYPLAQVGERLCEVDFALAEQPSTKVQALAALSRVLAERKQNRQTMQQLSAELDWQNRRFDAIATAAEDCIYTFDIQGRLIYANQALLILLGDTPERIYGRYLRDIRQNEESDRIRQQVEQVVATAQPVRDEMRLYDEQGRQAVYEYILTPVLGADGAVKAVGGIARNITERTAAASALRESEKRFRDLAELSPDAILVTVDGRIRYANHAALRLLAFDRPQDLLEQRILDFIHADYQFLAQMRMRRTAEGEMSLPFMEQLWARRDGSPITVEIAAKSTEWEGEPAIQVLARDIGLRKRADEALRASEARYRMLFEAIDEAFCIVQILRDINGHADDARLVEANPALGRMIGFEPSFGQTFSQLDPDLNRLDIFDAVNSSGEAVRIDLYSSDLQRWFNLYAFPIGGPKENKVALIFNDITEQMLIQQELRISKERLELAIHGSGSGAWDWNLSNNEVMLTPHFKASLGYAPDDLDREEDWLSNMHPDDLPQVWEAIDSCLSGENSTFVSEYRLRDKNGTWHWMLSRGVIAARDDQGKPLRMSGMLSDVSDRKQAEERVWYHANFDALTGLPNRRMFRDRLEWEIKRAQRNDDHVGLLFIDLDRFKPINDLLGHDAGDRLLVQAAQRIRDVVRQTDTVARLGGDEFTVILSNVQPLDHVEQVSQKLLDVLAEPFSLGNDVAYISASIGIALYPSDGAAPEELIRKADQAMYAAKSAGKNRFSHFTRSMDEKAHRRLTLANELRNALSSGQLKVVYQPVVDLSAGRIVKAEALLRWQHPRFGPIEPSTFIPLAEESGLINEIGDWVFREAATCSKRWSAQLHEPFQIGVNKSPAQFMSANSQKEWLRFLDQLELPKSCITIEITEGLLLDTSPAITDRLFEYRDAGVQVAIDDFGTGYSSMAYLKKFEIDFLKIDQSFVRDIESDASNRTIAESIIVMAHKLGLRVIAEGIETVGQMQILTEAGCDYGQGFLFSPPLPAEEFEAMLSSASPSMDSSLRH